MMNDHGTKRISCTKPTELDVLLHRMAHPDSGIHPVHNTVYKRSIKLNPGMIKLKYDVPVEISEEKYRKVIIDYAGCVPHREDNGKFYIKWWCGGTKLKKKLEDYLNS